MNSIESENEIGLFFFLLTAVSLDGYRTTDALSLSPPRLPLWLQWADDERYLGGRKTFSFDFSDN